MIFQSEDCLNIPKVSLAEYLMSSMKKHKDIVAVIDAESGERITYGAMLDETLKFITLLKKAGLRKGNVVGLVMQLRINTMALIIAISACGGTVYGCSMLFKSTLYKELAFVNASLVIVDNEKYPDIGNNLKENVPCVKSCCDLRHLNELPFGILLDSSLASCDDLTEEESNLLEANSFFFRTSGTSGEPKGIVHTQSSAIAGAEAIQRHNHFEVGEIIALVNGFTHSYRINLLTSFISKGVTGVILPNHSSKEFFEYVTKYKINRCFLTVVSVIKQICEEPLLPNYDISSLKSVVTAGTKFPSSLLDNVKNKLNVVFVCAFGCTECAWIAMGTSSDTPTSSVGKLLPGVKIKIVSQNSGKEMGYNESGLLFVQSPTVLKCYLGKTSEETLENGWFNTGDIALFDKSGHLFILGREKDAISQNGGISIFPGEFENILLKHPKVDDVAIVGLPHLDYQEVATAFIVKKEESLTEEEILKYFTSQVENCYVLMGGVKFVSSIPRIGLGKILRRKLRESYLSSM